MARPRLPLARLRRAGTGLIAFYTARVTFLLPAGQLNTFARELVAGAPADVLPQVYAGLSIGGAGSSAFITGLRELAGEDEDYQTAITTPNVPLTDPVYNLLVATLANVQNLPPFSTDSLPPPQTQGTGLAATGTTEEEPPPVPEPYDGQG